MATYKDVEQARINPLLHYLKFGRKEGRSALPPKEEPVSFRDTKSEQLHLGRRIGRRAFGFRLAYTRPNPEQHPIPVG